MVALADKSGKVVERLKTTRQHPFYVDGKGFVPVLNAQQYIRAINNGARRNPLASLSDQDAALNVWIDLDEALHGR